MEHVHILVLPQLCFSFAISDFFIGFSFRMQMTRYSQIKSLTIHPNSKHLII